MEYTIFLPCKFDLGEWYNIGIDFWPQVITAINRKSGEEQIILDLNRFAIRLDNRYLKEYKITQPTEGWVELKIIV